MRKYRGEYREIGEIEPGGRVVIRRPRTSTAAGHAVRVRNAINHIARTRDRKFKTRQGRSGDVLVIRLYTDAEFVAMGF